MACGVCGGSGTVVDNVTCTTCGGSGSHAGSQCSWCGGSGARRGTTTCTWCGGTGGIGYSNTEYTAPTHLGNMMRGATVVGILFVAGATGAAIVGAIDLLRTGSLWSTLAAFKGIFLFVLGLVISIAIPFVADLVSPGLKAVAFRLLLWVFGIAALFVVLQLAYHQLYGSSLVHLLRETLREPLEPVRAFVSPARILEKLLPPAMGVSIWLLAFSSILVLVSALAPVRENRGLARALAALAIVASTFLLL